MAYAAASTARQSAPVYGVRECGSINQQAGWRTDRAWVVEMQSALCNCGWRAPRNAAEAVTNQLLHNSPLLLSADDQAENLHFCTPSQLHFSLVQCFQKCPVPSEGPPSAS